MLSQERQYEKNEHIKSLTENQATGHYYKATTIPNVHQQDTANNKSLSRYNSAEERTENVFPSVTAHRLQNAKNVTIGALNVNSLRNKIGAVQELITNNIDICLLSETKIDETFPNQQFKMSNCKTFRRDRNKHWGIIVLHQ